MNLSSTRHARQRFKLGRICDRELRAGRPTIIGWQQHLPVQGHAALVTGIEGHLHGRTFEPHTLLLLDPAGDDPGLTGFNARLEYRSGEVRLYHFKGCRTRGDAGRRALDSHQWSAHESVISAGGCA